MSEQKPLRDWLLQKHEPVSARLDTARRTAVGSLSKDVTTWGDLMRELFSPNRLIWRTLAVAWLGLAVFSFTLGRNPQPARETGFSPELAAAWFAQLKSNETLAQIDHRP